MNLKAFVKTAFAIAYDNRAKIETIFGAGLVLTGTGIIISKATEACELADELNYRNNKIKQRDENDSWHSKEERSKEVKSLLLYAGKGYIHTYGWGVTSVLAGLTLIGISDITMDKQIGELTALTASYAATIESIKKRVISDQGEEKWQEYYLGPQQVKVEVLDDGTVVQTTTSVGNPNVGLPPHCYIFDEFNRNWEDDPVANRDFLEDHERYLNKRLEIEGFLFENEILHDMDFPRIKTGYTSGILAYYIDPETGDKVRNYLSFGLDIPNMETQSFRDGTNPSVTLQLNVENNIMDKLNLKMA